MRKVTLLWVVALLVLVTLLGSLMLASPMIVLGSAIYDKMFGQPVDPCNAILTPACVLSGSPNFRSAQGRSETWLRYLDDS
ncbi:hypothetical protein IHQ71_30820 (plasmid) [Rhizobium sp. TH2]|uniref:hypothetical protein n=1 Tax=Rhizobium sp. TH2 TaxID=2775403 RepID=UPI0021571A1D|nr:hypothetical protein [Rhizobium sp. TH2]UVC12397.1 hypothetical protein IHQ71_30820 [Rhizobium sp. TH2]